ncbi:MAG: phosphoethanolamine transferase [Pseudomonadota bacterium]
MLHRLRHCSPALKALLFSLIPLAYYLFDKLNYSQAGKAGVLGFFTLGTLFYWREASPQRRGLFTQLIVLSLFILTLYLGFQATLRDVFGVQQEDSIVVQAILSTDAQESREFFVQYANLILPHVVFFLIAFAGYWFLFVRQTVYADYSAATMKRHVWLASVFTFLLVAIHFNPTARKYNPLFYFPHNYLKWQGDVAEAAQLQEAFAQNQLDPQLNSMRVREGLGKKTVVFVLGESDTRNNWSLYGYARDTNPELEELKHELVVFRDIIAGDQGTIASITKMLTPATLEQPDLWKTKPTIMTIAKRAGYKVIWVTNQGSEGRGIVSLMAGQSDETVFTNRGGSRGEGSVDEVVFKPYEAALNDPAEKKLIVVHILGAHPAYNYRYPEHYGRFEDVFDDATARALQAQGRAPWAIAFRNMYDSAMLYQDYVLSQLLTRLRQRNDPDAVWLYIPDHGEDVAHNSDFTGHNGRVKEMWEVPMLFWGGANFDYRGVAPEALATRPYQADVIDHTLLGLMEISGDYYDPRLDIFSGGYDARQILPRNLGAVRYKDHQVADISEARTL